MTGFTIENIVISSVVADSLNLDTLAKTLPGATYNPSETPTVIIHQTVPQKAVIMFFSNGTMMCTGLKTMKDVEEIVRATRTLLQTDGVPIKEAHEIKIQSMVASKELNKHLDLRMIAKKMIKGKAEYNPKQFPGLVYPMEDHNAVILLFDSGKMVCTGTNAADITLALEHMTTQLSSLGI